MHNQKITSIHINIFYTIVQRFTYLHEVFMSLEMINIDRSDSNAIDSKKKQENSFHYSPVLLKRTVSFGEFNRFCNSEPVIYS